jgi:hypothetical protein
MRSFMNLKNRQNTSIRRECYSHMDRRESAKSWKGEKVFLLTTPNNLWRVPGGSGAGERRVVLPTKLQMYQAALQCSDDGLSTVIYIQPLQYRAHMTLHGSLGDAERAADLLVAVATGHQLQHFPFAGAQVRVRDSRS